MTLQTTVDNVTADYSSTRPQFCTGYTSQEQDVRAAFYAPSLCVKLWATWTSTGEAAARPKPTDLKPLTKTSAVRTQSSFGCAFAISKEGGYERSAPSSPFFTPVVIVVCPAPGSTDRYLCQAHHGQSFCLLQKGEQRREGIPVHGVNMGDS